MKLSLIFVMILFIISCSPYSNLSTSSHSSNISEFRINVTSYGSKIQDTSKTYYLKLDDRIPGTIDDLINSDHLKSVEKILQNKNYVRVKDTSLVDYEYLITVYWNISEPNRSNVTKQEPVYGYEDIPIFTPNVSKSTSTISRGFSNSINVKTTTITQPQVSVPLKVVTGYVPTQVEITDFKRDLNIVCRQRKGKELWLINSESIGSKSDLRYILKVMSFVISDFIELNSNEKILIKLYDNKPELLDYLNSLKN